MVSDGTVVTNLSPGKVEGAFESEAMKVLKYEK